MIARLLRAERTTGSDTHNFAFAEKTYPPGVYDLG
jgi:hypothetical protein